MSSSTIICYRSMGGDGKVTAGLASHLTHASQTSVVYPPAGSRPKKGRWAPRLHSSRGMAHFTFTFLHVPPCSSITPSPHCVNIPTRSASPHVQASAHAASSRQTSIWTTSGNAYSICSLVNGRIQTTSNYTPARSDGPSDQTAWILATCRRTY